jgi:hypothetical protein
VFFFFRSPDLALTLLLAFTMFNVFLPKLLETRSTAGITSVASGKTLEDNLWDVVIFTIGGCPGAIVSPPFSCLFRAYLLIMDLSAWCFDDRIPFRPQAVVSGKHVRHSVVLSHVCVGRVVVGRACKHGGHQFECDCKDFLLSLFAKSYEADYN